MRTAISLSFVRDVYAKLWNNPLGKIRSQWRPEDVPKRRPMDVPIWSSMYRQGTSTSTFWGRPLPTSVGRWNITSCGSPNVISWLRPHTVLYVTPWDIPYQGLEVISCGLYEDGLIFNSEGLVLQTFWGLPSATSWGRPEDAVIWLYK